MKIKVKVKFAAHLADEIGKRELEFYTENDIHETINEIQQQTGYPLKKKLNEGLGLLINGRSYKHYLKEGITLKEGDTLVVVPILGGG